MYCYIWWFARLHESILSGSTTTACSGALLVLAIVNNFVDHVFAHGPFPQGERLGVELLSEGYGHLCSLWCWLLKLLYPFVVGMLLSMWTTLNSSKSCHGRTWFLSSWIHSFIQVFELLLYARPCWEAGDPIVSRTRVPVSREFPLFVGDTDKQITHGCVKWLNAME